MISEIEVLRNGPEITGLKIVPRKGSWYEQFCYRFSNYQVDGETWVCTKGNQIFLGIEDREQISFEINGSEARRISEIISKLGDEYQIETDLGEPNGTSLIILFRNCFKGLDGRQISKIKKSRGRNPTIPKDERRIEKWKRTFGRFT